MTKILFIERKLDEFVSIEKVFRQVAENISNKEFETAFEKLNFGSSLTGIIKNLLFFRKPAADIYHITGHIHYMALVLPGRKTVMTIHDLRFLRTKNRFRRFILRKLFLDWPVKKVKYLTAISESTKKEIIEVTNCLENKIRVIENPLDQHLLTSENLREFNNSCPEILQIGTMENKNIPNLLKALDGITCKLRIIGRLDEKQTELLKESGVVFENVFNLNERQIRSEYENADIVAFCSTYEGFGLPIIEAQAMRKPVITSDLSPLKEVSGGAAYLADPFDFLSIRQGILRIIDDELFREELISRGIDNVRRFNPQTIAREYEILYDEVLTADK